MNQRANQKPWIGEGQTIQWQKEKWQKDKQYNDRKTNNTMTKRRMTERQTIQWQKEEWQKDKQYNDKKTNNTMTKRQTKHCTENQRLCNRHGLRCICYLYLYFKKSLNIILLEISWNNPALYTKSHRVLNNMCYTNVMVREHFNIKRKKSQNVNTSIKIIELVHLA